MSGWTGHLVYVIGRPKGWIASAVAFLAIAVLIGFTAIVSYVSQPVLETAFLGFVAACFVSGAVGFARAYHRAITVELYSDHVRLIGYDKAGEETIELPYSRVDAGVPRIVGNLMAGYKTVFDLSFKTTPTISWSVTNSIVSTGGARIPLYAWIREQNGSLTELERQEKLKAVREKKTML